MNTLITYITVALIYLFFISLACYLTLGAAYYLLRAWIEIQKFREARRSRQPVSP